jgi:hypothetical protein
MWVHGQATRRPSRLPASQDTVQATSSKPTLAINLSHSSKPTTRYDYYTLNAPKPLLARAFPEPRTSFHTHTHDAKEATTMSPHHPNIHRLPLRPASRLHATATPKNLGRDATIRTRSQRKGQQQRNRRDAESTTAPAPARAGARHVPGAACAAGRRALL